MTRSKIRSIFIIFSLTLFALSAQSLESYREGFLRDFALSQFDPTRMGNMRQGRCPVTTSTRITDDLVARFLNLEQHNQKTILDHCKEIGTEEAFISRIDGYRRSKIGLLRRKFLTPLADTCLALENTATVNFINERGEQVRWVYQSGSLKFIEVSRTPRGYLKFFVDAPPDARVHYSNSESRHGTIEEQLNPAYRHLNQAAHIRTSFSNFYASHDRLGALPRQSEVIRTALHAARGSDFRNSNRQFLSFQELCESLGSQVPADPTRRVEPPPATHTTPAVQLR